jgi:hypothetical protein
MLWQDAVFTFGQLFFFISLIPTIRAKEKPAFLTGFVTSMVLTVYIPTLWTFNLYVSVVFTVLLTSAWWVVTYQSWRRSRQAIST